MKTKFKEQKEKENLIIEIAKEYISTKDFIINIRSLADKYNLSKSTIHKYISHDLKEINYELYLNVKRMRYIKKISGIHKGGNVTKLKYEKQRKEKSNE